MKSSPEVVQADMESGLHRGVLRAVRLRIHHWVWVEEEGGGRVGGRVMVVRAKSYDAVQLTKTLSLFAKSTITTTPSSLHLPSSLPPSLLLIPRHCTTHPFTSNTCPTPIQTSRRIVNSIQTSRRVRVNFNQFPSRLYVGSHDSSQPLKKQHAQDPHSVDLLRNHNPNTPLGPFNGRVGTFAQISTEHFFITTNADYVPTVPSLKLPHTVFLRSDMHYGTGDPILWPQQYTPEYCHMPLVAKRGTLRETSPELVIPLFSELIRHIVMWIEQLETLPTTFNKMLFAFVSVQRAFLELEALHNYMTIYKPRIQSGNITGALQSHIPFWFLRPVEVFDAENILKLVNPWQPDFGLPNPDAHADGAPGIIYSGNSTLQKIAAIKQAAIQTPWYRDPFETTENTRAHSPSPAPEAAIPIASSSRPVVQPALTSAGPVAKGSQLVMRSNTQQQHSKPPYPPKAPKKPANPPED
ncbi:hypothetical protein B0H10DRAFT_2438812 [Mycena sp. CBHHK59/15]|nr:hypothetical protein B0H10DRAFT_2438812 [Mycena sp. CBHHK59/15]